MTASQSRWNLLAGRYIDRLAQWRKDEARLRAALEDPRTLLVPVWNDKHWIRSAQGAVSALLIEDARRYVQTGAGELVWLGEFRQRACFAIAIKNPDPPDLFEAAELRELKSIVGELPAEEAGLLAYARAMVHWSERHRFCGRCGAPTRAMQAGHVRQCTNETCGTQDFPRIDPAIIVLIKDGERALLGRQANWPPGRYSTIAGFVEPGESLEDAVVREVFEETGIEVDDVEYHSSQPWPFPASLMLGFTGRARTTQIRRNDGELDDARWVTREQIAAGEIALPLTHSISFRLIEDWFNAGAAVPLREQPHARMWQRPR